MTFETKYLIRWGIPGWVLIFWILYYYFALLHINPADITIKDGSKVVTSIIALTALGVPVGYLLHQTYFLVMWIFGFGRRAFLDISVNRIKNFPYEIDKQGNKVWGHDVNNDYFHLEYIWHVVIIELGDAAGSYWEARYRHLLNTIHGLGALMSSLFVSSIISYGFINVNSISFIDALKSYYVCMGFLIQGVLMFSVLLNFIYYSRNLSVLQYKVMNDYFKNK